MLRTDIAQIAKLASRPNRYTEVYTKVYRAFDDLCIDPSLTWQEAFRRYELPVDSEDLKVSLYYNSRFLKKLIVEGIIDGISFFGQAERD